MPSRSSEDSRSLRDDSEMPSTATIAAMPMAMPSADSAARRRRLRSPTDATRKRSPGCSALRGSGCGAVRHDAPVERQDRHAAPPVATASSCSMRPSRTATWRGRPPAMSRSWVMTRIVAPVVVQLVEQVDDRGARARVEVAGRLVGQDDRRRPDERPGDGHALALAAGELRRVVVEAVLEADAGHRGAGQVAALGQRSARVEQAVGDVVDARPCPTSRKNCWNTNPISRDRSPDSSLSDERRRVVPGHRDRALGGAVERADDVEQRRLPGSGRARRWRRARPARCARSTSSSTRVGGSPGYSLPTPIELDDRAHAGTTTSTPGSMPSPVTPDPAVGEGADLDRDERGCAVAAGSSTA